MMKSTGGKRKRTSNLDTGPIVRKKGKKEPTEVSSSPAPAVEDLGFWPARAILDERKQGRRTQYLVDWEPDNRTGKTFKPEWKFASDLTDALKRDWNEEKRRKTLVQSSEGRESPATSLADLSSTAHSARQTPERRGRKVRVIDSSSQLSTTPPRPRPNQSLTIEDTPGAAKLDRESSPLFEPKSTLDPQEPAALLITDVQVTQKSDFDPADYDVGLSQLPPGPSTPVLRSLQETPRPGEKRSNFPTGIDLPSVIPDSQSLPADSSGSSGNPELPKQYTTEGLSLDSPQKESSNQPSIEELENTHIPASFVPVLETDPIETSSIVAAVDPSPVEQGQSIQQPSSSSTHAPLQESQSRWASPPTVSLGLQGLPESGPQEQPFQHTEIAEIGQPAQSVSTTHPPSNTEVFDFQEAQERDRATQDWVSSVEQELDPSLPHQTFSETLKSQTQTQSAKSEETSSTFPKPAKVLVHLSEISSSPAPLPPPRDPETLATDRPERPDTPSGMPETRRSLRTSGAPSASAASSTSAASAQTPTKNLRSARGGLAAKKKELGERPQREISILRERRKREKEAKEAEEKAAAAALSSSSDSQPDSELQPGAIPAEAETSEPVVEHDAGGNSRLPARMPAGGPDDPMDTNSTSENEGVEAKNRSTNQSSTQSEDEDERGPSLEQMEFIVPLPMAGQARDQYRRTVKYNEDMIEKLTSRKWSEDASLLTQAESFVQIMRNIATHVDLTNDTASTQTDADPTQVIQWDRAVSTKFKFIHHLLDALRSQDVHLVIISKTGKLLDILENFLKGSKVNYSRPDVSRKGIFSTSKSSLLVSLLPSTGQGSGLQSANLILTLDHVIDMRNSIVRTLRQRLPRSEQLAPVLSLAVVNSVDHIERSLSPALTGAQRLRVLVSCIAKLRKDAGKTDGNLPTIEDCAMEVARFLSMGGSEEQWPLPSIGSLDNHDAWDLSQGLVSMASSASSDSEKSAKAKAAFKSAQKRRLERIQVEEAASSKKMRMTPQPDQDASLTRISDSLASQSFHVPKTPTNSDEMNALRSLLKATEDNLQTSTKAKDTRIHELEAAISELQYRFEEQTAEKRVLTKDLTEARTQLAIVQNQKESRDITIEKLIEEKRELKTQLAEARAALDGSTVPEVAAMEKLRQEKELAEEAKRKADRESATANSLSEYLRQQYSEATARAVDLAQQNESYEIEIKDLKKKASGEIARARHMFLDEQGQRAVIENQRLRQDKANLNLLLKRKEEDLRTRKVGIGTRAGSVPRSPRVGPTSRAGSPIPDRRIGAIKNNMNFHQQGRGKTKPPKQTDGAVAEVVTQTAPVIPEPKPKPGRPIEMKMMETRPPEQPPVEAKPPEPIPPAPRPTEMRPAGANTRPFPCCFAQYNCGSAFTSKNEWKRHISTKHIQLGFWRCDMCPPSPGIDHPVYNDFNRKDLFTQHLRRMHAVNTPATSQDSKPAPSGGPPASSNTQGLTDEQITEIQRRCYRQLRQPPEVSSCVFCSRTFSGPNSWEERLEHVGGHLERDRKNGTTCLDVGSWRQDPQLRDYLVVEGLVEFDPRGGYRIGDGKPRRPLDIEGFAGQQPTTQLTPRPNTTVTESAPSVLATPADGADSEGSTGKRRRGRPPKRHSEAMEIDTPSHPPSNNGPVQTPPTHQLSHQPYGPQVHSPAQDPRDGGPPRSQPLSNSQPPRQLHMPPANLQPMYEFRHGTFTKFQGTSPQFAPRPHELPPPALSTRAHGQPQLAPKPSPDPREEIMARIYAAAPQLAPKPAAQDGRDGVATRAHTHHTGFKAINEPRHPPPARTPDQPHLAPKPTQDGRDGISPRSSDGARQLAPKPIAPPSQDIGDTAEGVVTRRQAAAGTARPSTPQQTVSGAEEETRRQTRGKSFREVVMS